MLADLERLIELQQVDLRLLELNRQLQLFPRKRTEAQHELEGVRTRLEQARTAHTGSLKERKRLELDVQQYKEKIDKHRGQLYEVKSNEAYRALQHEIEEEQGRMTAAEDRVLEAMIAAEELEKEIKSGEAALKETEQRITAALRTLDQEEAAIKKETAELTAQREALRGGIADDMLETYDRIARAHGGIALAEARDEVCQVCLIHIRPQTYAEVRRNEQIHFCESCHRILYYVPVPQSGIEQPVSAGS
jgi:hypothetical protein